MLNWEIISFQWLVQSPFTVLYLIGLIIAIILAIGGRGRGAMLLAMLGFGLLILVNIIQPIANEWMYQQRLEDLEYLDSTESFAHLPPLTIVMLAGQWLGLLLVTIAVFASRSKRDLSQQVTPTVATTSAAVIGHQRTNELQHQQSNLTNTYQQTQPMHRPLMQPIAKGLYMTWLTIGAITSFVLGMGGLALVLLGIYEDQEEPVLIGMGVSMLAMIFVVLTSIIALVLLFKLWSAIQGPTARTSPGKAIGFLFIPFFNYYWIFQAYRGWAVDHQELIGRHNIDSPTVSVGLATTFCIFVLLAAIPYVGVLFSIFPLILHLVVVSKMIDAANAVTRHCQKAST